MTTSLLVHRRKLLPLQFIPTTIQILLNLFITHINILFQIYYILHIQLQLLTSSQYRLIILPELSPSHHIHALVGIYTTVTISRLLHIRQWVDLVRFGVEQVRVSVDVIQFVVNPAGYYIQ